MFAIIRKLKKKFKNKNGFSLMETLIVLVIIMAFVKFAGIPMFKTMVLNSKVTLLNDQLQQMRMQIEAYSATKGELPATLDDLVTTKRLSKVPDNPLDSKTGAAAWTYTPNNTTGNYVLKAVAFPTDQVKEVTTGIGTADNPIYEIKE